MKRKCGIEVKVETAKKKIYGKERMDLPPIGNLNNEIHPLLF